MIFSGQVNSQLDLNDLLLMFIYPISFMWFIYALLIMVVIQVLIGRKATNGWFAVFHTMLAFIMYFLQPILVRRMEYISFGDTIVSDVMKFYIYFLVGFYSCRNIMKFLESSYNTLAAISAGIVMIGANIMIYNHIISSDIILKLIVAFSGSLFFLSLSKHLGDVAVLSYIGKCSLSIYVLQGLSIAAVRQALDVVYHPVDDTLGLLPWLVCSFFGTIIPLVIYDISTKIWKFDFVFTPNKYIRF